MFTLKWKHNFFPQFVGNKVTTTPQAKQLVKAIGNQELTRGELMEKPHINDAKYFKTEFLQPALALK